MQASLATWQQAPGWHRWEDTGLSLPRLKGLTENLPLCVEKSPSTLQKSAAETFGTENQRRRAGNCSFFWIYSSFWTFTERHKLKPLTIPDPNEIC
ncbi:MAG: hypothetical protein R3C17_12175 [Planctomycetaceae bacterium]